MSRHQVPGGARYERLYSGHVIIEKDGGWVVCLEKPILVDGGALSLQVKGLGALSITVHDALWLSSELGMKIYDIGQDTSYVVGTKATTLDLPAEFSE